MKRLLSLCLGLSLTLSPLSLAAFAEEEPGGPPAEPFTVEVTNVPAQKVVNDGGGEQVEDTTVK